MAAVGEQCSVVITMLPDSAVVEEGLFNDGGVAAAMKPGGLVIEMSSGVPARTIAIGERLGKVDLRIVDAPVSGGLEDAALAGHSAPSTMRKSLSAASPSRRSAS